MLKRFLPAPILGVIALLLYTFTTVFLGIALFLIAAFLVIPVRSWRRRINTILLHFPDYWSDLIKVIMKLTNNITWEVHGLEGLKRREWYLMIANHRSWIDILALQCVFSRRIPGLRFFMKQELLWQLPIAGLACWLLGYPFMKRYSKDFLAKNPQLKGKDIATTRKACERFKDTPVTLINFAEGGRFSEEKYKKQKPPYRYLLKPKAGGMAFALAAMGGCLHKILNVTLIYPDLNVSFWDFLCGRLSKIIVHVEQLPISADLQGDYENDAHFRQYFQYWLNELWAEKDKLISHTLHKIQSAPLENVQEIKFN